MTAIVGGELTKFSPDVDAALLLVSCQDPGHKFATRCMPILSLEPVGISHNQFSPPQQSREWSDVDPDGRTLEFVQQFQELCCLWVSLCVRQRQLMCDRCEPSTSLKHLLTTQGLVPEGLLNSCEGLGSTFSKIGPKFVAQSLFLFLIHGENRHVSRTRLQINACENCPRPPSYVQRGTLTH
jgi:hypothetical protein